MSQNSTQTPRIDAIILAGGLSTRLGGVPKAALMVDDETLLARTLRAVSEVIDPELELAARPCAAVVGPKEDISSWLGTAQFPAWAKQAQENPPHAGPAAGVAAGLSALDGRADFVLVLACDMPHSPLLAALLAGALEANAPDEGVMAVDSGQNQPLAAIYPRAALQRAVDEASAAHRLNNASVFSLLASVKFTECAVPPGTAADIDTWEDAAEQGVSTQA